MTLYPIFHFAVSRHNIDVGTDDGNERFVKIFFVDTGSAEQTTMWGASIAAF
jgi:hypothetical protein